MSTTDKQLHLEAEALATLKKLLIEVKDHTRSQHTYNLASGFLSQLELLSSEYVASVSITQADILPLIRAK